MNIYKMDIKSEPISVPVLHHCSLCESCDTKKKNEIYAEIFSVLKLLSDKVEELQAELDDGVEADIIESVRSIADEKKKK
jgi:hypothetical protein